MKMKAMKSVLLATVLSLLATGAMAYPFDADKFQLFKGNTIADFNPKDFSTLPFDAKNPHHAGYYIWSNVERTDWTVLWTGDSSNNNGLTDFKGIITLYNGKLSMPKKVRFEKNDKMTRKGGDSVIEFDAWAGSGGKNWYDGFTFSLTNSDSPSYITFDLNIDASVFLGSKLDKLDSTFAVATPVPEPATMLLFGTGLLGIAAVIRIKKGVKK